MRGTPLATRVAKVEVTPSPTRVPTVTPTPIPEAIDVPGFEAGFNLIVYGNNPYIANHIPGILDRLVSLGVDTVAINIPIYQDSYTSNEIGIGPDTPSDEALAKIAQEAHLRNLEVMLRTVLDEATLMRETRWRGTISPENHLVWFENYQDVVLHYANLASETGMEKYSIGVELVSMESFTPYWLSIIEETRKVYKGLIVYSVNWNWGYFTRPFWEEVDILGYDAFFPLGYEFCGGTPEELVPEIQRQVETLYQFHRENYPEKPMVFTEIGTASQECSYRRPWRWNHYAPESQEHQYDYYKASCTASLPYIDGVYWWAATLYDTPDEVHSGFSPIGKLAERAITECFQKAGGSQ